MNTPAADTKTTSSYKDNVAITASPSEGTADKSRSDAPVAVLPNSKLVRLCGSTWFNVIAVGFVSFTQPGIWNALASMGAGGQQEPYVVNAASALTFGLMIFGCSIFGGLASKLGLRTILIIGTLGYAPYSAALYCNSRYGTQWFIFLGAITCGISASALFASEGAIAVGYLLVKERGLATGVWLGLRQFGQLIGAAVQLSMNIDNAERGYVGYGTYLALIGIQCAGLPLAFLVSSPGKAIRSDGTIVGKDTEKREVLAEFKKMWTLLKKPQIYLMVRVLVTFIWNSTYQSIYLTAYFSVRARTLASLTSAIGMILGDLFWGRFLDTKLLGTRTTAKLTWIFFSAMMVSLFGWQFANEHLYANTTPTPTFDWVTPGFGRAFTVNLLFAIMNESHYIFVYWLLGHFDKDVETLSLTVGLMRTFESLGATLAFAAGSAQTTPMVQLIISFVMFAVAIPPTMMVTWLVPEDIEKDESEESSEVVEA
ncbi:major facilitator superfamily domain-containing protein [Aspergillus crustosus]